MDVVLIAGNIEVREPRKTFRTLFSVWTASLRLVSCFFSGLFLAPTGPLRCSTLVLIIETSTVFNAVDFVFLAGCAWLKMGPVAPVQAISILLAMGHLAVVIWACANVRLLVWAPCTPHSVFVFYDLAVQFINVFLYIIFVYKMHKTKYPPVIQMQSVFDVESLRFAGSVSDDNTCAICLDPFEPGDRVSKLKCGHCYHHDCISAWMPKNTNCPLCKAVITPRTNNSL